MEFDVTTFVLEIINFLVLVWLLKHFLYKPVMNVISQRQGAIEKSLAEAQAIRNEAEALKRQYDDRASSWEQEKTQARQKLQQEMEVEKSRLEAALQASMDEERSRLRTVEQGHAIELKRRLVEDAHAEGGRFVARLLSRLASAELEERILQLLQDDLEQLTEQQLQALQTASDAAQAKVTSAFNLNESQRDRINEVLSRISGRPVTCTYIQDAELMAGLRISFGSWTMRTSLLDELQFFAEARNAYAKH